MHCLIGWLVMFVIQLRQDALSNRLVSHVSDTVQTRRTV